MFACIGHKDALRLRIDVRDGQHALHQELPEWGELAVLLSFGFQNACG
jgi:hypothetical protein